LDGRDDLEDLRRSGVGVMLERRRMTAGLRSVSVVSEGRLSVVVWLLRRVAVDRGGRCVLLLIAGSRGRGRLRRSGVLLVREILLLSGVLMLGDGLLDGLLSRLRKQGAVLPGDVAARARGLEWSSRIVPKMLMLLGVMLLLLRMLGMGIVLSGVLLGRGRGVGRRNGLGGDGRGEGHHGRWSRDRGVMLRLGCTGEVVECRGGERGGRGRVVERARLR
jgi:hypothetical protein